MRLWILRKREYRYGALMRRIACLAFTGWDNRKAMLAAWGMRGVLQLKGYGSAYGDWFGGLVVDGLYAWIKISMSYMKR